MLSIAARFPVSRPSKAREALLLCQFNTLMFYFFLLLRKNNSGKDTCFFGITSKYQHIKKA
jgi:hypothetical protein